jgi:hypothetical protein
MWNTTRSTRNTSMYPSITRAYGSGYSPYPSTLAPYSTTCGKMCVNPVHMNTPPEKQFTNPSTPSICTKFLIPSGARPPISAVKKIPASNPDTINAESVSLS